MELEIAKRKVGFATFACLYKFYADAVVGYTDEKNIYKGHPEVFENLQRIQDFFKKETGEYLTYTPKK